MKAITNAKELEVGASVYISDGDDGWVECKVLEQRKFTILFEEVDGDSPGNKFTEEHFNVIDPEYFVTK